MPPDLAKASALAAGAASAAPARLPPPVPLLVATALLWPNTAHFVGECLATGTATAVLAPRGHPALALAAAMRFTLPLLGCAKAVERAIVCCRPVLIIAADDCIAHILRRLHATTRHAHVKAVIAQSLGDPSAYPLLDDRMAINRLAQGLGMAVPAACAVARRRALAAALAAVGLPAYVKRDGTWGGNGALRAATPAAAHRAWWRIALGCSAARAWLRALRQHRAPVPMRSNGTDRWMVQHAVEGDLVIASATCWQGRVLAHAIARVAAQRHATGPATAIVPIADAALARQIAAIAAALHLSGPIGLDFITDATGTHQFIELNARLTPLATIADTGGGDQLCALLDAALGPRRSRAPIDAQGLVVLPV